MGGITLTEAKRVGPVEQKSSLAMLQEGQRACVTELLAQEGMRRRLLDLGLTPGTSVECELKSPSGDPAAYRIRGALIALRCRDAALVLVEMQ